MSDWSWIKGRLTVMRDGARWCLMRPTGLGPNSYEFHQGSWRSRAQAYRIGATYPEDIRPLEPKKSAADVVAGWERKKKQAERMRVYRAKKKTEREQTKQ